jgi:hypothetical protein
MVDMNTLENQFVERGIDARISDVILAFARTHSVVQCITDVDNFRLSVAPDAYAAVYPSAAWMDVALSPSEARRAESVHGLEVTKSNDTTAYVRVPASYLLTDRGRSVALELLSAAWDKAFQGPRWELGLGPVQMYARNDVCERCFMEKPVTSIWPRLR